MLSLNEVKHVYMQGKNALGAGILCPPQVTVLILLPIDPITSAADKKSPTKERHSANQIYHSEILMWTLNILKFHNSACFRLIPELLSISIPTVASWCSPDCLVRSRGPGMLTAPVAGLLG